MSQPEKSERCVHGTTPVSACDHCTRHTPITNIEVSTDSKPAQDGALLYSPPDEVWLQFYGTDEPQEGPVRRADITHAMEQVFNSDVRYTRAASEPREVLGWLIHEKAGGYPKHFTDCADLVHLRKQQGYTITPLGEIK